MKNFFLIILIILINSCTSSKKKIEQKIQFNNFTELERYWLNEFFRDDYEVQSYQVFDGKTQAFNILEHKFGGEKVIFYTSIVSFNNEILNVQLIDIKLLDIFSNGILYPEIISRQEIKKVSIDELKFLSNSPNIKRFNLYAWFPGKANPELFLLELTNKQATKTSTLTDFIKNSNLTFFKSRGIQI